MASVTLLDPRINRPNKATGAHIQLSRLAQSLFRETTLKRSRSGLHSTIRRHLRRVCLCNGLLQRLPIRYNIHEYSLLMPFAHSLADYRVSFPDYGENLGRVARRVYSKYPATTIIDIGANVGDSVAIVRHYAGPVPTLCIEPSEDYYPYLVNNATAMGPDITCMQAAVDTASGTITARLLSAAGTARLLPTTTLVPVEVFSLEQIAGMLPQFATPKLIKVDTDGFDGRILAGASGLLQRARPVVFWEFDPTLDAASAGPGAEIFATLVKAGYARVAIYTNVGDYLTTVSLRAGNTLSDLISFFSGRGSSQYADLCAFPEGDEDLAEELRADELLNAQRLRGFVLSQAVR
jgi:FkbM family methyltransferase